MVSNSFLALHMASNSESGLSSGRPPKRSNGDAYYRQSSSGLHKNRRKRKYAMIDNAHRTFRTKEQWVKFDLKMTLLPESRPMVLASKENLERYDVKMASLKAGVESDWDRLPQELQERIYEQSVMLHAREQHEAKWKSIMADLMSFGDCTCSNNPECEGHHPRNVLINWRYKVRYRK